MTREKAIQAELAALRAREKELIVAADAERAKKRFQCVCCPKMHTIGKCDAFTFPKWESGSGYDDGRWWEGEIYILCPDTGHYNRCYFDSPQYPHYSSYEHSAEMQFKRIFKSLFKSLTQADDNKRLPYPAWHNNHYFDQNHAKFGLHAKGVDK